MGKIVRYASVSSTCNSVTARPNKLKAVRKDKIGKRKITKVDDNCFSCLAYIMHLAKEKIMHLANLLI